jgi:hypothetical protein
MTHAPDHPQIKDNPQALSRRAALLLLAGGFASIGLPPPLGQSRTIEKIVVVDGWVLRIDDIERMPGGVG